MPKKPEDWLEVASPPQKSRGIFKLFLGYAPGVGKTFSMLSEAIRRHSRGEDVVIGVVETHGRKGVVELAHSKMLREPNKEEFARALDRVIALCKDKSLVDRAKQYKAAP